MAFHLEILRSGSSGNCSLLTVGQTRLLIDAGIGPRVLAKELELRGLGVRDLDGVIYTHCHSDHLRGNTIALLAREGVPIHLNAETWRMAVKRGDNGPLDKVPGNLVRLFDNEGSFELKDLSLSPFQVTHGRPGLDNPAGDPVGFVMTDGHDTFGYCTDIGHVTPEIVERLRPADLLVFECNHDVEMVRLSSRPWNTKQWIIGEAGHLNNHQAASALSELFENREGRGVILAHLSEMCNTVGLARETAREALAGRCEARIGIANRHHATPAWILEKGWARPEADYTPVVTV